MVLTAVGHMVTPQRLSETSEVSLSFREIVENAAIGLKECPAERTAALQRLLEVGFENTCPLDTRAQALVLAAENLRPAEVCTVDGHDYHAVEIADFAIALTQSSLQGCVPSPRQQRILDDCIERWHHLASQTPHGAGLTIRHQLWPQPIIKIGVVEEKPGERRAPLTPAQCTEIRRDYPALALVVQASAQRIYGNADYSDQHVQVVNDLPDCDLYLGLKEMQPEKILPGKSYCFFSHTFKGQQPGLLKKYEKSGMNLIDWELIKDKNGRRLIGFGYYAGVVGAYNGLRGWGQQHQKFVLAPPQAQTDLTGLHQQLTALDAVQSCRVVVTGVGRAGRGAVDLLEAAGFAALEPSVFLADSRQPENQGKVYTVLRPDQYMAHQDGRGFDRTDFTTHPENYRSAFLPYAACADIFIPCHYHPPGAPVFFTADDAQRPDFRLNYIADVSCDIAGPIPSTVRPSTLDHAFYAWDPRSGTEVLPGTPNSIGVMAVDNLPSAIPRDASKGFGEELIANVLPHLLSGDPEGVVKAAVQLHKGRLMPAYAYLNADA